MSAPCLPSRPRLRRFPRVPILAVWLLIIGPWWLSHETCAQEVGGSAMAPSADLAWTGALDPELEIGLQWLVLSESDMDATYGGLPLGHLRVSMQASRSVRFYLGLGYGRSEGNPFHGLPAFEGEGDSELVAVPVQMGIRGNVTPNAAFRLNLGCFFEGTWIRETLPSRYPLDPSARIREEGWTRGVGFTFGPEWRSRDGGRGAGFEGVMTGNSGGIGDDSGHEVNLSGMAARLYFTTRI